MLTATAFAKSFCVVHNWVCLWTATRTSVKAHVERVTSPQRDGFTTRARSHLSGTIKHERLDGNQRQIEPRKFVSLLNVATGTSVEQQNVQCQEEARLCYFDAPTNHLLCAAAIKNGENLALFRKFLTHPT